MGYFLVTDIHNPLFDQHGSTVALSYVVVTYPLRLELPFHNAQHARRNSIYGCNFSRETGGAKLSSGCVLLQISSLCSLLSKLWDQLSLFLFLCRCLFRSHISISTMKLQTDMILLVKIEWTLVSVIVHVLLWVHHIAYIITLWKTSQLVFVDFFRPLLPLAVWHILWIKTDNSGTALRMIGFTFFQSILCPFTTVSVHIFSFNCSHSCYEVWCCPIIQRVPARQMLNTIYMVYRHIPI